MALNFEAPTRSTSVAGYIERRIVELGLKSGDRIGTKKELQQECGVARATVNEAVRLLHDRGRVILRSGPSGGLFVADSTPGRQIGRFLLSVGNDAQTVADAIVVRDFLETMVLREAVAHRNTRDIQELREAMESVASAKDDSSLMLGEIWKLHERIAFITPNEVLKSTYCGLIQYIRDHVTGLPVSPQTAPDRYTDERVAVHNMLVDAIASGDLELLNDAIRKHNEVPPQSAL